MKHIGFQILCFMFLSTCLLYSQNEKFYFSNGNKIFLNEVKGKYTFRFDKKNLESNKAKVVKDEKIKNVEWLSDTICMVDLNDTISQLKPSNNRIVADNNIKAMNKVYRTQDGLEMAVTNEIIARFNSNVSQNTIQLYLKKYSAKIVNKTKLLCIIDIPVDYDVFEISNELQKSGLVKYCQPNFIAKLKYYQMPTDEYFSNQYYLHNTGQILQNGIGYTCTQGADINAPEAWEITKGNNSIVVAILDQGVRYNPDLLGANVMRLNGSNFGNGDRDDSYSRLSECHGDAIAGIIAAQHNNEGIAGIAPNCKIMPVRFSSNTDMASMALAISFAKNNGADIISNSWGYDSNDPNLSPAILDAIEDATTTGRNGKGCVVLFAAGNSARHLSSDDGYIGFPANNRIVGLITVGASDRNDVQANYSPTSHDSCFIDIVAPSSRTVPSMAQNCDYPNESGDLWTTDIHDYMFSCGYNPTTESMWNCNGYPTLGTYLPNSGTNYEYYTGFFGGTSAACPQVAAVAALILSVDPDLTQQEVSEILMSTARKAGSYSYGNTSVHIYGTWNPQMGYGVLDAYAAVLKASCISSFTDQTVTSDKTIYGCDVLDVENVQVSNNAKLKLISPTKVTINGPFTIETGSSLDVR